MPPDVTEDEVIDALIEFVEPKGRYFGGGVREIRDGFYINPDGTKENSVLDKE